MQIDDHMLLLGITLSLFAVLVVYVRSQDKNLLNTNLRLKRLMRHTYAKPDSEPKLIMFSAYVVPKLESTDRRRFRLLVCAVDSFDAESLVRERIEALASDCFCIAITEINTQVVQIVDWRQE